LIATTFMTHLKTAQKQPKNWKKTGIQMTSLSMIVWEM
jgi:hypothetical protein